MPSETEQRKAALAASPPSGEARGGTSSNVRVVHVRVPEPTFNFAKAQAYLSGMDWPDYVAKLLEEARPFPGSVSPLNQEQAPAQ